MSARSRVLLVSEDESHFRTLELALNDHPELTLAQTHVSRVRTVLPPDIDLLLLDLPAVEPFAQALVESTRKLTDERLVPLVLFSEAPTPEFHEWSLNRGAEDLLSWSYPLSMLRARVASAAERWRLRGQVRLQSRRIVREKLRADSLVSAVVQLGLMFSANRDFTRMLERILLEAKSFCAADAGTLYLRADDDQLHFKIMRTDSLGIALGGTSGREIPFPPLSLMDADGSPNHRFVVTSVALTGRSINIPDVYAIRGFDFSGTRAFDEKTGYRSCSFLTAPLKNDQGRVIGVLQLINALDPATGAVIPFDPRLERMIESLSSLAAAALESHVREQGLRRQIEELKIEVDDARKARQVAEITETDYFATLQQRARQLRRRT